MNKPVMQTMTCKDSMIAYERLSNGSPIVFAHCSGASHKEWLFAADKLAKNHTCFMPDLLGYGQSSKHIDESGQLIACRDYDVIAAMVDLAGGPVEMIAHSYGAATCLEFALKRPESVRSLFLIEPVSFHLLSDSKHEAESQEVQKLGEEVIQFVADGKNEKAAQYFMEYWIGQKNWALASSKYKESVTKTISKVAFEFSQMPELQATTEKLKSLDIPITLIVGGRTPKPTLAIVDILAEALPRCKRISINGAGHMSPFTHQAEVMALIEESINEVVHD